MLSRSAIAAPTDAVWRERSCLALLAITAVLYGAGLTSFPTRGEETRWGTIARHMLENGDWVVPRLQGTPFVDRPPLHSWTMAALGAARGSLDRLALRLPSVLAVLATTWLVYVYARTFLAPLGAFSAGLAFATGAQVLQLGRVGENDALFTMFVAGSLLVWHDAWQRERWLFAWCAGGALAAAGALQKGAQAPVYFAAATGAFLLWRREWRRLFDWRLAAGVGCFALVLGAWLVPFWLATDASSAAGMWTRTVQHRFGSGGLARHVASFPLETFACLLPWSPLLLPLALRRVRREVAQWPAAFQFCLIAVIVTYPSVWFVSEARSRYFMPLYPCLAVLVGAMAEWSALAAPDSALRRHWNRFLLAAAVLALAAGAALVALPIWSGKMPEPARPSLLVATVLAALAFAAGYLLLAGRKSQGAAAAQWGVAALAVLVGGGYLGAAVPAMQRQSQDIASRVAQLPAEVPALAREELVSLGPVLHQFEFYYPKEIPEHPWPLAVGDLPAGVEWFCFTRHPGDTEERRQDGRALYMRTVPGRLPFAWEQVATVPCGRLRDARDQPAVVIGRVVDRGEQVRR